MQESRAVPRRRALMVVGAIVAGLMGLALIVLAAGALWLTQADLRPLIERHASDALGREVSIGEVRISWGNPLGVEVRNFSIANAPWGSEPEMIRLGQLSALIDVASLVNGPLRYERLRLADLQVVLERDGDGTGNWKFAGGGGGGLGLVPKTRGQFPILIDFIGEKGAITYRTRSGNLLRIDLDRVTIRSPDAYSPVILQAVGAYNDVAARLDATTDPYFILHEAATPFGTRFAIRGNDTDIGFEGTMMEPLDFEGVRGDLSLTARKMDDLLAVMGSKREVDLPLLVVGKLARDRDYWSLSDARGRLLRASFNGRLELLEGRPSGARVAPDDLALDLDFGQMDAAPILAAFGGASGEGLNETPLHPSGLSDINLTLTLSAERLAVAGMNLPSISVDGRLEGGTVNLRDLKFLFGGGTLAFDGSLQGDGESGDLRLNAHLIQAQAGKIVAMLGGQDEIRGALNGSARLRLRGSTLGEGLKRSSGAALVTLAQGDIARSLVEQVSADLRSLFRTKEGRVPVTCLLAAMTVENGIGTLSPLRLESEDAILLGGGTVDLVARRLDLTLQTEGDSTSIFALDIPIQVSGPFDDLAAGPGDEPDEGLIAAAEHADVPQALPKGLRDLAQANACAR